MKQYIIDAEFTLSVPPRLVCIGIKEVGKKELVHVIDHRDCCDFNKLEQLKEFFSTPALFIGHHIQQDIAVLEWNGIKFHPDSKFYDTGLAIRNINENETRWDLKSWATYLGISPYWYYFEDNVESPGVANMDLKELVIYNAWDLKTNEVLYKWCLNHIKQEHVFQLSYFFGFHLPK